MLDETVQLGRRCLVKARPLFHAQNAHRLEYPQGTQGVGVGGELGLLEGNGDMTLRSQVVYLVGLHLLDHMLERKESVMSP